MGQIRFTGDIRGTVITYKEAPKLTWVNSLSSEIEKLLGIGKVASGLSVAAIHILMVCIVHELTNLGGEAW